MLRDVIIALSLSNLCLLPVWEKIGYLNLRDSYFAKTLPTINSFGAFIILVMVLAVIFWGGIRLVRRLNNPLVSRICKVFFCLIVLNCYYVTLVGIVEAHWLQRLFKAAIIIIIIVFLIRRSFTKMSVKAVLVMAPLVLIIMNQAAWAIIKDISAPNKVAYVDNFLAMNVKTSQNKITPRVVWLILDRVGQQSIFDNKQNNARLPEFNRLRQHSLVAENAYPPNNGTFTSIPALFTGKRITKAAFKSPDDLLITYQGTAKPVSWRSQPSIFSYTKERNLNAALVGWCHPYSRIYAGQVAFCSWDTWTGKYYDIGNHKDTLLANINAQVLSLRPLRHQLHHIQTYLNTLNNTTRLVADSRFDVIVVHLPVPHGPDIFDEATGRLSPTGKLSFFGNLLLTDQTLTKIREAMEEKGLWDRTNVIISADHKNDSDQAIGSERIPFIVKLAGQNHPLTYNRSFNTVLTKDLIVAIMDGKIKSENEVVEWLDRQHR